MADPETIASAVANKAIFFMTFPITCQKPSLISGAPAADHHPTATKFSQVRLNLERRRKSVKQKKQTTADFLGVWPIPRKVVAGCCI